MKIFCLLFALMLLPCPAISEMFLLFIFLFSAAVLDQSLAQEELEEGEEEEEEEEEITGSGVSKEAQKEILDRHNEIRRKVDPPAANMLKMVWSEEIGERARKWAENCKEEMSSKDHRNLNDTICGEIIFQANYANSWSEVIDFWDKKKSNFKYGVGPIASGVNIYPYTQMIWYKSYQVGCGVSYCPESTYPYFYVCQYCPSGNIQHEIPRPYKKGKSCEDCPRHCENKLCTNPCKHSDKIYDCKKVKELFSCKKPSIKKKCKATCSCKNAIV